MGLEDPRIIDFSLKMAEKFKDRSDVDGEHMGMCMKKLKKLRNKFSKEVPRPAPEAARKGKVTKDMNAIRKYLRDL